MAAGDFAAQMTRFFNGENRRMIARHGFDAKSGKTVEKVLFCCGHNSILLVVSLPIAFA
jgi:hypothetical protein